MIPAAFSRKILLSRYPHGMHTQPGYGYGIEQDLFPDPGFSQSVYSEIHGFVWAIFHFLV